jgi:hypothetical protein
MDQQELEEIELSWPNDSPIPYSSSTPRAHLISGGHELKMKTLEQKRLAGAFACQVWAQNWCLSME